MRHRVGDRDLEYTWFTSPGHVVNRRGDGRPGSPFVDAAGVHRLSWEIFVPSVAQGTWADWHATYSASVSLNTTNLPLLLWDRPVNDPDSAVFTTRNLAIEDLRVWGGDAGVVAQAAQPNGSNSAVQLSFRTMPDFNNVVDQYELIWRYSGPILTSQPWNRYDGNAIDKLPFAIGARGKGLYFEVRNFSASDPLNAGRLRISALVYEI